MSKEMYRVGMMFTNRTGLKLVTVEHETDKCVWVNGRRENKQSNNARFFDRFDHAKQFALNRTTCNLEQARLTLEVAQRDHDKITTLTVDEVSNNATR